MRVNFYSSVSYGATLIQGHLLKAQNSYGRFLGGGRGVSVKIQFHIIQ